jgi:hypothetical protein
MAQSKGDDMSYCNNCSYDCICDGGTNEVDAGDDWIQAAKDLLSIIGAVCVLGYIGAIFQKHF